jgi:predicted transposase YbfD/YdcC
MPDPELVDINVFKGGIIKVDILDCQTEIIAKVIEKEADYLFALKHNLKGIYE